MVNSKSSIAIDANDKVHISYLGKYFAREDSKIVCRDKGSL